MLKKISILLSALVIIWLLYFVVSSLYIFKKIDITKETNNFNANLPYIRYNFENALIYEGVFNDFIFWEVSWTTTNNKQVTHSFKIQDAFNLRTNHHLYYRDFTNKNIKIFWYMFLFFAKPHLNDSTRWVYTISGNKIVIWLWNIEDFTENYLHDTTLPSNRKYDDLLQNLDYIPHMQFELD